ncbi:MAG: D-alanyl-D-alanine carboxypeptidase [Atopobiaceae bacterium]|nr:D-alanyl-D-alanine carboxypeptidase [Atopobiaceae bacterium]
MVVAALLATTLFASPAHALDTQPELIESSAACVTDASGNILFDYNATQEMPLASITKIMTAMVALDSGKSLSDPVPISEGAFQADAQLAGYKNGDTPTFDELLKVMLVFSGNDAAANVALATAGSEAAFVDLMNQKAAQIGMTHSHFANPHGLEQDGHYSCAADLCLMGRYALEHYPYIREAVQTRVVEAHVGGYSIWLDSTDELMEYYDGLLGIKTGLTESGASFLGAARRNNVTLYSCSLCCETGEGRFIDSESMLDWGFSLYNLRPLARSGWTVRMAPWADGFWLKCPVSSTLDVTGAVFCEGDLKHKTVGLKSDAYVECGQTCETTIWSQEGRQVQSAEYRAASTPVRAKAWNPIVAPLF